MWQVLLNSLTVIAGLAFICVLLVKRRGTSLPTLKSLFSSGRTASAATQAPIVVRQRTFLGWKSSIVEVSWRSKDYLLVVQEGRCTVVDCLTQEPVPGQQDNG